MTTQSPPRRTPGAAADSDAGAAASVYHVTIAEGADRLDRALAAALPQYSRSRLKALIEAGRVSTVGATITEPSQRVKPGAQFTLSVPEAAPATPEAESIALDIKFEDASLLVLDKPAGLVVHPAPGNATGTLVNALLAHCGDSLQGIGGVRRPGIVHRLDKDTSGLMVVAKTEAAMAGLAEQFAARDIERAYNALVWGAPSPAAGEIEGNIGRSPQNRKKMAVVTRGGKTALTRYRTLHAVGTTASLVECRLATGRTHQIRVHMAHRGHPIVGDPVYGGGIGAARRKALGEAGMEAVRALGRQALHARTLGFRHPESGKLYQFVSEFPDDINGLLSILEPL
jgi:23S rRNA pseudouridine1911/1915/1917 synthase